MRNNNQMILTYLKIKIKFKQKWTFHFLRQDKIRGQNCAEIFNYF